MLLHHEPLYFNCIYISRGTVTCDHDTMIPLHTIEKVIIHGSSFSGGIISSTDAGPQTRTPASITFEKGKKSGCLFFSVCCFVELNHVELNRSCKDMKIN